MNQINPSDPAALRTWVAALCQHLATLHALSLDATARRGQRRHSRRFLRDSIRRETKRTRAHLATLDAPGVPEIDAPDSEEKK